MYILVDVYDHEVEIVNCYRENDLSRAKNDLVERFTKYVENEEYINDRELAEDGEYSIDPDHMWAWIDAYDGTIDLVIKTV